MKNNWSTDIQIASDPDRKIETVFKVEPPLMPLEGMHGFLGVILRDTVNDLIQCHVCGSWFNSVMQHAHQKHGLNAVSYKRKFGLPLNTPLTSVMASKKMSEAQHNKKNVHHLNKIRESSIEALKRITTKQRSLAMIKATTNMAFKNKHGLCPEQVLRRYLLVSDRVGRDPSYDELRKYDPSLLAYMRRENGTLNGWRGKNGIEKVKPNPVYSSDHLLSVIRDFVEKHQRIPSYKDFIGNKKYPYVRTFQNHFGSVKRAVELAGVRPDFV